MIVSFSVSNFRSFSSEETLSLVASNRLSGKHEDHAVPIPDTKERVLRTAVLYGANGAGKSNLFKALRYLRSVALRSRKKSSGTGREPFRFDSGANQPSSFDLQFIAGDKLYRFGVELDDQRIVQEWLVRVVGNKEKILYERVTDDKGAVIIEAPGLKNAGDKVSALVKVGGPQNQSFLATVHATLEPPDYGEDLAAVLDWFNESLTMIAPDESFAPLGHRLSNDSDFLGFAGEFLKSADTGVECLNVVKNEVDEDELRSLLPADVLSKMLEDFDKDEEGVVIVRFGEGNDLLVEKAREKHFYRLKIQASHENYDGKVIPLDLKEESDGTRRLLNLLPALHHLRTGSAVYFIDEIDRSMHPMLAIKFLEFFLRSCEGERRQVIITTHESNLLDHDILRRDEIWFAEKDRVGATRIYSLAEFKVRNDLDIRKHYLQGRFGAIPFLGNLERLLPERCGTGVATEKCD